MNTLVQKIKKKLTHTRKKAEKEYRLENQHEIDNQINFNPALNELIDTFKNQGGVFNGFAIAESAMRALLFNLLLSPKEQYNIIELGGGQSTLFFDLFSNRHNINLCSYEHDLDWHEKLSGMIKNRSMIKIHHTPLHQVTDEVRELLMRDTANSRALWKQHANPISSENDKNTRARNCFYNITDNQLPDYQHADAIIIDGPHGNGRSLSYSILNEYFTQNTLVLIDDYHHYPFMEELRDTFDIDLLIEKRYRHSNKGWILARIKSIT